MLRVYGQRDGFQLVAQPHFSGSGALIQRVDDITVVFIDIYIKFFKSSQIVKLRRMCPGQLLHVGV